ncbi:AraC family transcriptional regulator [Neobacillus sp. LXY-4]|uniref:helix-turn-helix transcriptional regulator n=1 Tax=Neobacillus sp. LXY-4 TaxID=3379826 RepID=UPI003EE33ABA
MEGITLFSIQLIVNCSKEKDRLSTWIQEEFQHYSEVVSSLEPNRDMQILVVEISKLLDWVFIHRLKKQHKHLIIFPLLNKELLHTVPLTMELDIPFFFVKPVKRNFFTRTIKRAILRDHHSFIMSNDGILDNKESETNEALQELFLRRLLRGDVKSHHEFIESRLFSTTNSIPNTVVFIQGFVKEANRENNEGWHAPQIIQKYFNEKFQGQVFFVPYRKHLLMLLRVPSGFASPRDWQEGEDNILSVISELQDKYGIYLYIGVGTIYNEPLLLHHSYIEAKTARRTPPYERLVLRYFDETAKEKQILKSIEYIGEHYAEEIPVTKVAAHINFSPTYFSRLFKKETGRSFVEFVTYVRLQRAIALIRHSNNTIEQIAEELGFNTPNYFCNIFKKYVGLTPSEYRATKEILFY